MKQALLTCLFLLGTLLAPASAEAHQSSFSYASIQLSDDARSAYYEVRLSTKDLFEALGLEEDRDATDSEIVAGSERLTQYVFDRVTLRAGETDCSFASQRAQVITQGDRFAQVRGELTCTKAIESMTLDYQLFFDLDPRHEGLLRVDGKLAKLSKQQSSYHFETGHATSTSAMGWVRSGFDHVIEGLDHILFLVALLLVVAIRQSGPTIHARSASDTLRQTAVIVTAFTVGHSLTLIIASLGWLSLPARLVESMIAASIVYVAIENLIRREPKRRYLVTFGFGLMHGLGFAAMLQPLLPPDATVVPLLIFNVGVELGQLAIVAVCLPALFVSLRTLGVASYRRHVLSTGCVALSLLGTIWFLERALEIQILGLGA